jgi:hypothetical protein
LKSFSINQTVGYFCTHGADGQAEPRTEAVPHSDPGDNRAGAAAMMKGSHAEAW